MSLSTAVFIAAARARAGGTLPVHPGAGWLGRACQQNKRSAQHGIGGRRRPERVRLFARPL